MYQLTVSIVLYNNKLNKVKNTIDCVLQSNLRIKLFLIDNSETDDLRSLAFHPKIEYIFSNRNTGYGPGHNIAIRKIIDKSEYHLVLNPDVYFDKDVLENIYHYMQQHTDVGLLLPKVFYENGDLQKLCNLLPKPVNLIGRRFLQNFSLTKKVNDKYELKGFNYDRCLNVPNLSGCFMFLRCSVLKQTGLFDERYFMYMEDVDLCRRIHAVANTIFYSDVSIIHGFEKESYSNNTVLKYHIQSAIKYFNKWGWIFDKERDAINHKTLKALNLSS